ncbi:DUF362 domain-containing protein [bacterium]|nr:DUF362 domain-containing protein [bacterium]
MTQKRAAVLIDPKVTYCKTPPFHPAEIYPELSGFCEGTDAENRVYGHVRECLKNLGLDAGNFGTAAWNPFGELIKPGERVLIKPNLVLHFRGPDTDIESVVTHGSVIRPLVDYALKALDGQGEVVIGDAPHGNADFEAIVKFNGLAQLVDYYREQGQPVVLRDFRKYQYGTGPNGFVAELCREVSRDPEGYQLVSLGERSFMHGLPHLERLYGSDYDRSFIVRQQVPDHRYLLSGTLMKADVVIGVPKMKTHKKVGVTLNLKNLVGVNGDKNYLPHYRVGPPSKGGDEYPDTKSPVLKLLRWWHRFACDRLLAPNTRWGRRVYMKFNIPFFILRRLWLGWSKAELAELGDWPGNDTTWRMCLDLNDILLFADKEGRLHDSRQRKYFTLIDGITAGEQNGPMFPLPKPAGYVACGFDPFLVDYVCAYQMGFDPEKIPLLATARRTERFKFDPDPSAISCVRDGVEASFKDVNLQFLPHKAWRGTIER